MSRNIIIATIFVVIGLVIGLNLQQPQSILLSSPINNRNDDVLQNLMDTTNDLQNRLNALETQQSITKIAHQTLNDTIESFKNELNHMNLNNFTAQADIPAHIPSESITIDLSGIQDVENVANATNGKTQTLLALGIDETVTSRIQQREEKFEMDRLYLRNSAIREGWFGTEKYFEKTRGLNATTNIYREELGDSNYDRYLFNSNQSNRVSVLSIISSSPAEESGLESGDIISQYDHKAIFSWSDITNATTNGEMGQQVSIVVQREGEEIELFVPRGPLGIRLENTKVNPDP